MVRESRVRAEKCPVCGKPYEGKFCGFCAPIVWQVYADHVQEVKNREKWGIASHAGRGAFIKVS